MRKFLALLILLLSLPSTTFAGKGEPLISLREDSSGHGMRTRELMLRKDGTVVVESYDFYKAGQDGWHVITVIRKVPRREIGALVEQASSLAGALPELVDGDRSIPLDPDSKAIRIKSKGVKLFSGWAAYQDAPPSTESQAFQDAWKAIEALLAPPGA